MISRATTRSIVRWVHLIFAIPIFGYIYSPFEQIPNYAAATPGVLRYFFGEATSVAFLKFFDKVSQSF
jgi:hypothetical protein